ncbi:PTS mannose transporter subunit IIA, partial [Enterococcus faecalis]
MISIDYKEKLRKSIMNVNPLYQVFLNQELLSKQQVYQFIAETAAP